MIAVLLTINILVVAAMIVVVLLQRSEGGAVLGGGGGFMTGRGAANALTRTTMGLAAVFFVATLSLAYIASHKPKDASLIDQVQGRDTKPLKPGEATSTDLLRSLGTTAPLTAPAAAPGAAGAPAAAPAPAPTDKDLLEAPPAAPAAAAPAAPDQQQKPETAPQRG